VLEPDALIGRGRASRQLDFRAQPELHLAGGFFRERHGDDAVESPDSLPDQRDDPAD
jgi:hypothetical protein